MKGKEHEIINILLLPPVLTIIPAEGTFPFSIGYIIGTFFISPDIDIPHSRSSKRWNILKIFWYPLWMVVGHRGVLHIPIVGTFVKLIYLLLIFFPIYNLLESLFPVGLYIKHIDEIKLFYFTLGIIIADILHILLDVMESKVKRLVRKLFF